MCRSIKPLRSVEGTASDEEIHEAALQFVRKVSGIRNPTAKNAEAFTKAVEETAAVTARLLGELPASKAQPPQPSRRVRA
jgi:hypothetical protein